MKWFVATDGTVFTDQSLYRKHEMETQYTFRDRKKSILTKNPGSIQGQPFVIDNCQKCKILLIDYCDQVQINDVSDSKIFIGASSGSIFIGNCTNCTFTIACKQLRTRDCKDCTINLYCKTEPAIETSTDMRFGPFNGAYPGHTKDMQLADLDPSINKWQAVHDFNDPTHSGVNWRILEPDEQDPMWYPLGKGKPELRIPMQDSSASLFAKTAAEHSKINEGHEKTDQSTSPPEEESGPFHMIKVFGHRAWTIISQTVVSIQAFCTGLIFSGMQIPNKMLSSGR
ncbi:hypothetical protein ACHAWU_000981 [Discostella pseudostelligera]|uniref:C-CAP/cofactor C-like domain-containing protein n=1 Tax=Discostella pseudostelligera TaxID=259834 RepID=A0ABD3MFW3_9STRA